MTSLLKQAETAAAPAGPHASAASAARLAAAGASPAAEVEAGAAGGPRPLAPARWDWSGVRRVLVVRLRSIGDAVLATPTLHALRRFLPHARVDLLLEDWVAPLFEGSDDVDRVVAVGRKSAAARLRAALALRAERYDVVYNLHGGSTAALLTRATGAPHRVGYRDYAYSALHSHTAPPSSELWGHALTHSVEQQLALAGWTGVPVSDRPATRIKVAPRAAEQVAHRLRAAGFEDGEPFALFHTAAAFESKTWSAENFARVVEHLAARGLRAIAVAAPDEAAVVESLRARARAPLVSFTDLSLPQAAALAKRAALFVGNDSGVAHVAAAVRTPQVVVFGSSNVAHWRPWATAPAEVVREEMPCAPCAGYTCGEFAAPECVRRVSPARVVEAVERILQLQK